ncbi:hypothetical protein G0D86_29725 (plasmid) [Burkholderia multivorans]|uniref:hypothetical protein n=1 Tax=Burkholderia multivorans TaxID=87883 RepID=UPI0019D2AF02|nr:hypothetical protein [Burkholderia multivorans]QSL63969.1 hypothetical protein G0D86_29725 [Burkholderia multivorans]
MTFFPNTSIDNEPLPPSRTERVSERIATMAAGSALSLQAIGAVPLHAVRDAGLGTIGWAADSIFDQFHGIASTVAPQAASWAEALPVSVAHGVYFGALALSTGALIVRLSLGMSREQKNSAGMRPFWLRGRDLANRRDTPALITSTVCAIALTLAIPKLSISITH